MIGGNFYKAALENMNEAIYIRDLDKNIVYMNPASETLTGWSLKEARGKKCYEVFGDGTKNCPEQDLILQENRLKTRSGEERRVQQSTSTLHKGNTINGIIVVLRDITGRGPDEEDRLKLEAQCRQAQKFESLNVMAGNIAHNFNNLLMLVLGNLELAQRDLTENAKENEYIQNARKAAKRAADLSTVMLTYVGQSQTEPRTVELNHLVEEMTGMLKVLTGKKVSLIIKPNDKSLRINSDPDQIRRILENLVINAVEAVGEDQGTIFISTGIMFCRTPFLQHTISGEELEEGDYVFIEVSDNGRGMDEETRQKIFDPFFTTKKTGRGLGLSTVLGFLRSNKGAISVDTQNTDPRKGTTIRVLFPNLETTPKKTPEKKPEVPLKQGKITTVLLVDEDDVVLELGKDMLEELGYNVITALSGRQAIDVFKHHQDEITCIMLDMNMPDISVDHTLTEMQRIRADIPVLISSGYADNSMKQLLQGMSVTGFIPKPYSLSKLSSAIEKSLHP